ncbi:MAG: isoprenyl transferase [Clostridiales bacterium]|jgi:undecaprenyl diphosphate synthase|nr:isoprenyl transferase [Clostridiales bacterium]HOA34358.1 isoprenyl transferase [Clostridiales bacterium]HPP67577.1 isoprenyl transferase [Clostridiales bacterium]HPU66451.1 isoprenyl transferase [Clostridiales bacterium]HQA05842.1 isoprenyl transferase [Clostridiales bacterium]
MANSEKFKDIVLPRHVGVIMDGNGRWAKKRGLPRYEGHREGAKTFRRIAEYASEIGIKNITFYAFSSENWKRPPQEVNAIMQLLREYLDEAERRQKENEEKGIRIRFIGDLSRLPEDIRKKIEEAQKLSEEKTKCTVSIAVNYGGRQEIVKAVRDIAEKARKGEIKPEDITEADIENCLYTAGIPDADLIIRPSGEKRLSNFLTWQSVYAEFYYTDVLWPDFTTDDFDKAILDFANRDRRFGGV